jgi:hypothetical protein
MNTTAETLVLSDDESKTLDAVLEKCPDLGIKGFRQPGDPSEEFAKQREHLTREAAIEMYANARKYCHTQTARDDANPALDAVRSSRSFVGWLRKVGFKSAEFEIEYMFGPLIAAALSVGAPVVPIPGSNNALLGFEVDPDENEPGFLRTRSECSRGAWAERWGLPLEQVGDPPDEGIDEFSSFLPLCPHYAEEAKERWRLATPCNDEHPFLRSNSAKNFGLRVADWKCLSPLTGEIVGEVPNAVLIPMRDEFCDLVSVFALFPDHQNSLQCDRQYLPGIDMGGTFFRIGSPIPDDTEQPLVICETYLSGCSIHEATGFTVLVAFDAFNLRGVAEIARRRKPNAALIIAAGDDRWPTRSRSWKVAREASAAVSGHLATPCEPIEGDLISDFNTMHRVYGLPAVERAVRDAVDWWF